MKGKTRAPARRKPPAVVKARGTHRSRTTCYTRVASVKSTAGRRKKAYTTRGRRAKK